MKLKLEGYKQASLAVQKMNYAVRMYRKVVFEIVDENDEEYIMLCKLQKLSTFSLWGATIMIREFQMDDINKVADIWLDTNIKAHNFIPAEYWKCNRKAQVKFC